MTAFIIQVHHSPIQGPTLLKISGITGSLSTSLLTSDMNFSEPTTIHNVLVGCHQRKYLATWLKTLVEFYLVVMLFCQFFCPRCQMPFCPNLLSKLWNALLSNFCCPRCQMHLVFLSRGTVLITRSLWKLLCIIQNNMQDETSDVSINLTPSWEMLLYSGTGKPE